MWLHNPCLVGVPIEGCYQYGYITAAELRSPQWEDINVATKTHAFSRSQLWGKINMAT